VLLSLQVPIYAAYLYDAVNVYARALKEALDNDINPRNGTAIVDRIRGRMYDSKLPSCHSYSLFRYTSLLSPTKFTLKNAPVRAFCLMSS